MNKNDILHEIKNIASIEQTIKARLGDEVPRREIDRLMLISNHRLIALVNLLWRHLPEDWSI